MNETMEPPVAEKVADLICERWQVKFAGGCVVAVFEGPFAEQQARNYARKLGRKDDE